MTLHQIQNPATFDPKIQTVQGIYEAFGRGDVAYILDHITDDVDWASCPGSTIAPWHDVRNGKDGVTGFFQALASQLDVTEFTTLSFTSNDTDVMTVTRFVATSRTTGKTAAMDIHHWWRFRGDKVSFYRGTEDTAATAEILRP